MSPPPSPAVAPRPGHSGSRRVAPDTLVALALTAAWAAGAFLRVPWPVVLTLALGTLTAGVCLLRRCLGGTLVGPLFFHDLVRLARRGRSTLLRCTYTLLLLAALCFVCSDRLLGLDVRGLFAGQRVAVPAQELARVARTFSGSILLLQIAAALVLTPAYLAGAIAEEKERRTIELLFTTQVHNREIVLGKLFARLLHLAGVLLAGLPILSLTQLWGGVDGVVLAASFAVTGLTLFSVGTLSILCSVLSRTVLTAMVNAYMALLVCGVFCFLPPNPLTSPFAFHAELDRRLGDLGAIPVSAYLPPRGTAAPLPVSRLEPVWVAAELVGEYATFHGILALLCLSLAIALVRSEGLPRDPGPVVLPPPPTVPPEWLPAPPFSERARTAAARGAAQEAPPLVPARPPVSDQALLWKELYYGGWLTGPLWDDGCLVEGGYRLLIVMLAVAGLLLFGRLEMAVDDGLEEEWLTIMLRVLGLMSAGAWCLGAAFGATGSITRERDQGTLEGLLLMPVERREVLRAKWLGAVLRGRFLGCGLLALWTFGLLTAALHPLAVLLLALSCAAQLAFLTSLGIWLSLVCRNTLWAQMTMSLVVLLTFCVSWAGLVNAGTPALSSYVRVDWLTNFRETGVNPLGAWWVLGFSWREFAGMLDGRNELLRVRMVAAVAGILLFAVAAVVFWLAACWRFRAEQTR